MLCVCIFFLLDVNFVGAVVPINGTTDKLLAAVDKRVVVVTWNGEHNVDDPPMKKIAALDYNRFDTRVNDGKCDAAGRFWIGKNFIEKLFFFLREDFSNISFFFKVPWLSK